MASVNSVILMLLQEKVIEKATIVHLSNNNEVLFLESDPKT